MNKKRQSSKRDRFHFSDMTQRIVAKKSLNVAPERKGSKMAAPLELEGKLTTREFELRNQSTIINTASHFV